jgi:uncharacterized membrane protein YgdD (TMEM256/DUF423 family)
MHVSTLTHKSLFAKSIVGLQSRLDFLARPWCDPLLVYWFLGVTHFSGSDSWVRLTSRELIPWCDPLLVNWFLGVTHFSWTDSLVWPTSRVLIPWCDPLLVNWFLGVTHFSWTDSLVWPTSRVLIPWCDPLLWIWFLGAAHFSRSDSCVWPTSQDQIPGCAPLLEIWFLGVTHFSGSDSWLPPTSRDLRAWYRPLLGIWFLGGPASRDLISYHWICQIFLQSPAPFQRHLSASNSAPLQPSLVKGTKNQIFGFCGPLWCPLGIKIFRWIQILFQISVGFAKRDLVGCFMKK